MMLNQIISCWRMSNYVRSCVFICLFMLVAHCIFYHTFICYDISYHFMKMISNQINMFVYVPLMFVDATLNPHHFTSMTPSCHISSCHVISYHNISSHQMMSMLLVRYCFEMSSLFQIISYHIISYQSVSCHTNHVMHGCI